MTHGTVVRWIGQACFVITTLSGMQVLIDPPHPEVGYQISANSIPANIVFVSHEHSDHNFVEAAKGRPTVVQPLTAPGEIQGVYEHDADGVTDTLRWVRIFAYHDNDHGRIRGPDTITAMQIDGLRICHLGDLGQHELTPEQVHAIGRVDVLMIPVGGYFTIDARQAVPIIDQLHPRVIIPMHYRTPAVNALLQARLHPITEFEQAMAAHARIVPVRSRDLVLSVDSLPSEPTVYILRYD